MIRFPNVHTQMKRFYSDENSGGLPERSGIDEQYLWNTKDIFESDEVWEKVFKETESLLDEYEQYIGKLGDSVDTLYNCLKLDEQVGINIEKLHLYSMLQKDSDMRKNEYQAMNDKIMYLYAKAGSISSFIRPEILQIDENSLQEFMKDEKFSGYEHFFDELLRMKDHTLPVEQERLLAMSSEMASVSHDAFSIFTNADVSYPSVQDEQGNTIEVTSGRYSAALYSKSREFRKNAYEAHYKPYKEYANTFSTLLNGGMKANIFYARARNYQTAREAALSKNNIPVSVYDNLITSVRKNIEPMHRWADLKRKILNVDSIYPYDMYVGLFDDADEKKYSYEDGIQIVKDSLKPLGEEYLASLDKAFANRWIDVFETKGKRSGAYSSGSTFGVHPYVLLNWNGMLNDVFTLAHEMGHNMHSYFTGQHQPYVYSDYTIFVAEVASTFNESLLLDYLLEKTESKKEKLMLLERYCNNVSATFYRQTMFAEFEKLCYENIEKGIALTPESFREIFKTLFQQYWGDAMTVGIEEEHTWARVPHFYYNFYVYQYATGFAASEALVKGVKEGGQPAVEKYLKFLRSGSSDYSINLLKHAGVDMSSDEPVKAVASKMNAILDEMEKLV